LVILLTPSCAVAAVADNAPARPRTSKPAPRPPPAPWHARPLPYRLGRVATTAMEKPCDFAEAATPQSLRHDVWYCCFLAWFVIVIWLFFRSFLHRRVLKISDVIRWKTPFNVDMIPSDACVLNSGSLIESSTLYIERRFPPYDSSLGVFSLPPLSFPKS
jgi:hypothetical protein